MENSETIWQLSLASRILRQQGEWWLNSSNRGHFKNATKLKPWCCSWAVILSASEHAYVPVKWENDIKVCWQFQDLKVFSYQRKPTHIYFSGRLCCMGGKPWARCKLYLFFHQISSYWWNTGHFRDGSRPIAGALQTLLQGRRIKCIGEHCDQIGDSFCVQIC